ncbi:glycosyltransferase family 4 protein [candidate division KSB1 bacterium]|nr:glycosyltransferase family 4 protein [candidate division KSB1 bacterium]
MKTKILFIRKFKKPSGGQFKVRDYFRHCLAHPQLEPHLYLMPDSDESEARAFWDFVPHENFAEILALEHYDLLFLAGRDWEYVPTMPRRMRVINYIQHVKHAERGDKRFQYLSRPAWRVCVSEEVAAAIAPHAAGEIHVIKNGIPLEMFSTAGAKHENSIFIWARKNPALGQRLFETLQARGLRVELLIDLIPREEFAGRLQRSEVFVALPHETEGFYLPALEAMAAGCAVICSDAVGNRGFCKHEDTCLMPAYNDEAAHLRMIEHLLIDSALRTALRRNGKNMAQEYSLAREREAFYGLVDSLLSSQAR